MAHVALAQRPPDARARTEVMNVVVQHVVRQISHEEARAHAWGITFSKSHVQGAEHDRPEGDADGGWHHEAQRIIWMLVVDAVDDPMHTCAEPMVGLEMKH